MPTCIHKKIEEKTLQKTCVSEKMANFAVANRARGVIGSRARLRIWCLTTWGFESLRAHNNQASFSEAGLIVFIVLCHTLFCICGLI